MPRVNWIRALAGGLLAGVLINIVEFVVNGWLLQESWSNAMKALNRSYDMGAVPMIWFNVWGFLTGIAAVLLYVAMRQGLGAGWKTALYAGLAVWFIGPLLSTLPTVAMHMFPRRLLLIGVVVALVEVVAATEIGAWVYRDKSEPRGAAA